MKACIFLLLLLPALLGNAQKNLSGSARKSIYTYIYQLSPDEAFLIYKKGIPKNSSNFLHTLKDSFITGSRQPLLPAGNYLLLHAAENKMVYELKTAPAVGAQVLNNKNDVAVLVHHEDGSPEPNAVVTLGGKKLSFDPATHTYRANNTRRSGTLEVYHQNTLHLFNMSNNEKRSLLWKKAGKIVPAKFFAKVFRSQKQHNYYYNYFESKTQWENKFRGYMVFSRPKYKPGDTVQFKAFITNKKGKPVDRNLLLRLSDRYFTHDTILATLKPYRKGGYSGSFVLSTELDLDLDDQYLLALEELRSRKYNMDTYDGDLDEDEYALKRKVLMRGTFEYEEYELTSTSFTARADKKEHHRDEPIQLFMKATDENGLAAMDGRVTITVLAQNNEQQFHAPKVFLPDTLWHHEQPLEAIGETQINLPDSIFPAASFSYTIHCRFRNSNNELHNQILYQHYQHQPHRIAFQLNADSLHISMERSGKKVKGLATVHAINRRGDTVQQQKLNLPASIRYNPFVHQYQVNVDSLSETYTVPDPGQMVSVQAVRTHDSIWIKVANDHRLPLWYTLFAGNKAIFRGASDTLFYMGNTKTKKNYFLSLQHIAGGQTHSKEYPIPYQDKLLQLTVQQPQTIYPGQQTEIAFQITDGKGKPVPDADVTAYAFTNKFSNTRAPFVPYLGRIYGPRATRNSLSLSTTEQRTAEQQLVWKNWSRALGLDTIEYYRFLYPDSIYRNYEPAKDSITQIAPFVVKEGMVQPIHLLYIDEQPVFFSRSQQLPRYSFAVHDGKHALRLRTANSIIYVDSIWAEKGLKSIFAINADTSNKYIRVEKAPDTLTRHEQELWTRYMILVENNFGEKPAYIQQGNNTLLLSLGQENGKPGTSMQLVGPLNPNFAQLVVTNRFKQDFEVEGGFQYRISKGLIRQKWTGNALFPKRLPNYTMPLNFRDLVLTEKEIDSLWQQYLDQRSAYKDLFHNERLQNIGNGKFEIAVADDESGKRVFVKNVILFRNDDPDFVRIYKGTERSLGYLKPGRYRLMLLLLGDKYFIQENIMVQPNGTNFYTTETIIAKSKDSISNRIAEVINNRELASRMGGQGDVNEIKETFHAAYLDRSAFTQWVEGRVLDEHQKPIAGAAVSVKDSAVATVTNSDGFFGLYSPPGATLVVSAIGYAPAAITSESGFMGIAMLPVNQSMAEVVVIGYGVQKKASMTGAMGVTNLESGLAGKVAGITIRGAATANKNTSPLIILDGVPFSGSLESIDPATIANISVLKVSEATAIYGAAGENGVVIITTYKQGTENASEIVGQQNSLRSNFRDYAYWQPRLRTDKNGRASFNTTFPDDITRWRGFAIAMDGKKRSGFMETTVRSFKALNGVINLPQFITWNDTVNIIGKTQHYLPDSVQVQRSFSVNDSLFAQNMLYLKTAWIDTFAVKATTGDSIKFKYTIQKQDGYFDGEERAVPLIRPGTLETKGMFAALEGDTTFTLTVNATDGPVKIYAEASLLPVLLDETEHIRTYEYFCNEQLASKLKALLAQRKIFGYLKKQFNRDSEINEIISRLNKAKSASGLWGWWNNNPPSLWISRHAVEALLDAEKIGFKINLNKQALTDHLVFNLEETNGLEKLEGLNLLHSLNAKVDYRRHLDSLYKDSILKGGYARLRLLELEQKFGFEPKLDTLLKGRQRTMMGNIYWGQNSYRLFDNSIQHTLTIYKILRHAGGYTNELQKMRNYFLEQRRSGKWRNTYESSLILETILPDMLQNDSLPRPASLAILGNDSIRVTGFLLQQK